MKKSILMAIVALALLAAPAFAGDYSITGNIDWGFGASLGSVDQTAGNGVVTNDFTMLGFFGSIDDNNSIAVVMEYGASGSGAAIYGETGVVVQDFNLSTNILGALGVTGVPVTLNLTAGHGRLNLHDRFQQWTGWEVKRWKDQGAAHMGSYADTDPGSWSRPNYVKLTVGIMDMVNVAIGVVPYLNAAYQNEDGDNVADIPLMVDIWTSGIVAGPAALDIALNLRADGHNDPVGLGYGAMTTRMGGKVTANMNFGAIGLTAMIGDDYYTVSDVDGGDNFFVVAVKPSYNFGAGSVALGIWFSINTFTDDFEMTDDDNNLMDMAIDVSLSYATFTLYGGVIMRDISDIDEGDDSPMKYDIGVKNSFGAATIGLGVTGISGYDQDALNAGAGDYFGLNAWDLGAADGSGNNWMDQDPEADDASFLPTLYFRVTAWY